MDMQTFKFEEVQTLTFEVYDVDTAYSTADATNIDPAKQVRNDICSGVGSPNSSTLRPPVG